MVMMMPVVMTVSGSMCRNNSSRKYSERNDGKNQVTNLHEYSLQLRGSHSGHPEAHFL